MSFIEELGFHRTLVERLIPSTEVRPLCGVCGCVVAMGEKFIARTEGHGAKEEGEEEGPFYLKKIEILIRCLPCAASEAAEMGATIYPLDEYP